MDFRRRNKERSRDYKSVLKRSRVLTKSFDADRIDSWRISCQTSYDHHMAKAISRGSLSQLKKDDLQSIAIDYQEAASPIEIAGYLAVAQGNPLLASIYFRYAFETYIDYKRFSNRNIECINFQMDSLRKNAVACYYGWRRQEARRECRERFLGR